MDPNATLQAIRQILAAADHRPLDGNESETLTNLFIGLDEWLSMGGFLPLAWTPHRKDIYSPKGENPA